MRPGPTLLAPLLPAILAILALGGRDAQAGDRATYRFDPGGQVRAVRVLDVDRDGRRDLVVLLATKAGGDELLVLRTPAKPLPRRFFPRDHITRISCGGSHAQAGAVALGRFGPKGGVRLRFLGPEGARDVTPAGTPAEHTPTHDEPTLFARSPGRHLVFWDGVADLDGDGIDECWYPLARGDGPLRVHGGTAASERLLDLTARNTASSNDVLLLARHAYVPNIFPADLDGDGSRELVALRGDRLLGWSLGVPHEADKRLAPSFEMPVPFLAPDPDSKPQELRTPRIQIADVDGDGHADLLVTLITGVRTNLASIRTIFFHYPGPFRNSRTGQLVPYKARIDTQSIVLHPSFVDLDGDGDLDYVGDAIRGGMMELLARLMGQDPKVTFTGFRYDKELGTFERVPYFTVERTYAAKQALSNSFGRSGWFRGDFDGDGHKDLLDLGNLGGVEILRGTSKGKTATFQHTLLARVPVPDGLVAAARVADLNNDHRADAVLWSATHLYLVVSKGGAR